MPLRFLLIAAAVGVVTCVLLCGVAALLIAHPDLIALALLVFALLYLITTMRTR